MSRRAKTRILVALTVLVALAICALAAGTLYALRLPEQISEQNTRILGQSRLIPGAPGLLHVQVQRYDDARPVAGADVKVSLKPEEGGRAQVLYEGSTDAEGRVAASFTVPEVDDPQQQLVVETRSDLGRDTLEQSVTVERSYKVLLTTDKPLYQPGQQIQIRALALGTFDRLAAAGSEVEVTVADAKGNKVFRKTAATSEFGVAAWTFQLADEVNHGNYKITAALGDTSSEKTVVVKPYVLPKFKASAATDETFYRPGQRVTGQVEAAYFFGKPVADGQVQLAGWVYDVERQQVLDLEGRTGEDGTFAFEFDLPDHLVGSLEGGVADYILEVAVTDGAAHTEQVSIRIPVAQQGILIEAVPESGEFKPSLENIVYLLTSYPDGAPAECDLTVVINGRSYEAKTGPYGLGELRFTPDSPYAEIQLSARDALGHTGEAYVYVESRTWSSSQVLLRPDRATYRVGDTMNLEVLTTEGAGSVYLDVTREGQTLSTRTLEIRDGRATAAVDLTPDLYGTLALHAYKILPSGEIVRDTRLVVVDAATDLSLNVQLDRETYLPGGTASLQIGVSGQDGTGVPSALGLAIVDESVFALQEQDPGFAKLYFLLEKELLEPKFDLHGLSFPQLMADVEGAALQDAQNTAAKASLAGVGAAPFGLTADSHLFKLRQAKERQTSYLDAIGKVLYPTLLLIPLVALLALGYALWREGVLLRSLAVGAGLPLLAIGWLAAVLFVIPLPGAPWADTPLDKLGYLIEELGPSLLCLVAPALLGGLAGGIGLAVRAIRKAEWPLGIALLMLVAYAARSRAGRTPAPDHRRLCGSLPGPAPGLWGAGGWLWLRTPGMGPGRGRIRRPARLLCGRRPGLGRHGRRASGPYGERVACRGYGGRGNGARRRRNAGGQDGPAHRRACSRDAAQGGSGGRKPLAATGSAAPAPVLPRDDVLEPRGRHQCPGPLAGRPGSGPHHHHLAADRPGQRPGRAAGLDHGSHPRLPGLFRGHRPAPGPHPGRRGIDARGRLQLPGDGPAGATDPGSAGLVRNPGGAGSGRGGRPRRRDRRLLSHPGHRHRGPFPAGHHRHRW
jgi:hypothetical protein